MDPIHHQKIADKLMQYRGKIPKTVNPSNKIAVECTHELKKAIDDLLWYIERYSVAEDMGLI
jgi:hypothetical protein